MDATFPLVRLADLAAASGGVVRGDAGAVVRDAAYDSRAVTPGSLFFCIPGANVDGHAFARDALAAGAAAFVAERPLDVEAPQLLVESVRAAGTDTCQTPSPSTYRYGLSRLVGIAASVVYGPPHDA